jgi:hypothetical protein
MNCGQSFPLDSTRLEVNAEKTKCILLPRHQNRDITIANGSSENVLQFRYLVTTVTSQNLIQEEIRADGIRVMHTTIQSRSFFSSRLLSKNIKLE